MKNYLFCSLWILCGKKKTFLQLHNQFCGILFDSDISDHCTSKSSGHFVTVGFSKMFFFLLLLGFLFLGGGVAELLLIVCHEQLLGTSQWTTSPHLTQNFALSSE